MQILSIGKGLDNQIVLEGPFVSRHHAQLIIYDDHRVEIKDLGSSNGTFVNGTRITNRYLNNGDTVKCGEILLPWTQYSGEVRQPTKINNEQPGGTMESLGSLVLFPNENKILTSNSNNIILTNYRIHMAEKELGRSYGITIFLEDISSVQLLYKSNFGLLILALLSTLVLLYSLSTGKSDMIMGSLLAGLLLLLLWFLSRKHIVSIHPDGGKPLEFEVGQMPGQQIENFVNKLQLAKAERMSELSKH